MSNKLGTIICLIGPSGSGKDTIKRALPFSYVISHRTRKIRDGEVDGVDGWFEDIESYKLDKLEGNVVADTEYPKDSGNYLWINKSDIKPYYNGEVMSYVVDYNGYELLREKLGSDANIVTVFINVDLDTIRRRMELRGDSEDNIRERLANALIMDYPAKPKCDIVVNNYEGRSIEDVVHEITVTYEVTLESRKIITRRGV